MNHIFMSRLYIAWHSFMFPYGFYRQWGCEKEKPFDLFGHRAMYSIGNGIFYCSPFGVCKLFNLINRIDIHYHAYDKKSYNSYNELFAKNYSTF